MGDDFNYKSQQNLNNTMIFNDRNEFKPKQ